MVGFGLYGSIHGPSEYDVTIQLLHTGKPEPVFRVGYVVAGKEGN